MELDCCGGCVIQVGIKMVFPKFNGPKTFISHCNAVSLQKVLYNRILTFLLCFYIDQNKAI